MKTIYIAEIVQKNGELEKQRKRRKKWNRQFCLLKCVFSSFSANVFIEKKWTTIWYIREFIVGGANGDSHGGGNGSGYTVALIVAVIVMSDCSSNSNGTLHIVTWKKKIFSCPFRSSPLNLVE